MKLLSTALLSIFGHIISANVHKLTNENFTDFIKTNPLTMVEFYAPWCGHCKNFEPEYKKLGEMMKDEAIKIAKVDGSVESDLISTHKVSGFPTLIFFHNGETTKYEGPRNADTIIQFMRSYDKELITLVSSLEEAKKTTKLPFFFIGSFKAVKSETFKKYNDTADSRRAFNDFFAIISSDGTDEVYAYRASEGPRKPISITTKDSLNKYIDLNRIPYFDEINGYTYGDYDQTKKPITWFVGSRKDYEKHYQTMFEAAKQVHERSLIGWLDVQENLNYAKSNLGVSNFPAIVQTNDARERFLFTKTEFTSNDIVEFVNSALDGKLEKHLMSEEPPLTNDEPVKIVVGKTFNSMVFRPDADVILDVYAPWCGHCKKLEPIYKEFAEKMASNQHLVVAKIDNTENDIILPEFSIQGYPTIFFVKAGTDKPIRFTGESSLESLTKFVEENASTFVDDKPTSDEL